MTLPASRLLRNNQQFDGVSKALLGVDITLGALFLLGAGAVILASMHVPFLQQYVPHFQQVAGTIKQLSPVGLKGAAMVAAGIGAAWLLNAAIVAKLKHDGSQELTDLPVVEDDGTTLEDAQARYEKAENDKIEAIRAQQAAAADLATAQEELAQLRAAARPADAGRSEDSAARIAELEAKVAVAEAGQAEAESAKAELAAARAEAATAKAKNTRLIAELEAKVAAAEKTKDAAEARIAKLEQAAAAAKAEHKVHAPNTAPAGPPPPPPAAAAAGAGAGAGAAAAGRNPSKALLAAIIKGKKLARVEVGGDAARQASKAKPEGADNSLAGILAARLDQMRGAINGRDDNESESVWE